LKNTSHLVRQEKDRAIVKPAAVGGAGHNLRQNVGISSRN